MKRLLQRIHRANAVFGPVYMSKVDLSDCFYWLWLWPEDTLKLAVLFPSCPGEVPLVGIPLTNPMGWCLSPQNFNCVHGDCGNSCQRLLGESVRASYRQNDFSPFRYHLQNGSIGHPANYEGPHQKVFTVLGYLRG